MLTHATVGGQGITSGFRDVSGLAWRLELMCRSDHSQYERLLKGWCLERKDQLDKSLAATVENGEYCNEKNPFRAFVRDTYLWLVQLYPPWRRQLEQGARRFGMTQYAHKPGMPFVPGPAGGKLLPQVYCVPLGSPQRQVMFTDDAIFSSSKTRLLQLVILTRSGDIAIPWNELADVETWSKDLISATEATMIVEDPAAVIKGTALEAQLKQRPETRIVRVATADEFASSELCSNRPPPMYYDELRMGKEVAGAQYLVVRKDRFIFAACANIEELRLATQTLPSLLGVAD